MMACPTSSVYEFLNAEHAHSCKAQWLSRSKLEIVERSVDRRSGGVGVKSYEN